MNNITTVILTHFFVRGLKNHVKQVVVKLPEDKFKLYLVFRVIILKVYIQSYELNLEYTDIFQGKENRVLIGGVIDCFMIKKVGSNPVKYIIYHLIFIFNVMINVNYYYVRKCYFK